MSRTSSIWKRVLPGIAGAAMLALGADAALAQTNVIPPLPILSNRTFPVNVTNDSPWFTPMRVSIVQGDSVKWTNRSQGTHTITSLQMAEPQLTEIDTSLRDGGLIIGGIFDRRAFLPGQEFLVTFTLPGTYPYVCFIHPYMAGNITVTLPGLIAAGPVPDIIQGTNTPNHPVPSANGFGIGVGEVCMTADFEKPSPGLPSGVVHCIDARSFQDLPLAAFDANPAASVRTLGAGDVGANSPQLIGRQIGGRFEGIDNAHNIWYDRLGTKMFVTEWHGSNFWTCNRMTNSGCTSTFVFSGADVTHVMTTLPAENVGVLTLEGGVNGSLGFFDPATSTMIGFHSFGPLNHPHGPGLNACGGAGGTLIEPFPMSNRVGFTRNLPASPQASQLSLTSTQTELALGIYPVATWAQSAGLNGGCGKAYTSNAVSGTMTVNDIQSGSMTGGLAGTGIINLPLCTQCTLMGVPAPHTTVPIQTPVSPDNRFVGVAMGKASQVAIIDTASDSVVNVVDCGSGCHGGNMGAKRGGGFYGWFSMQYQNKMTVVDFDNLVAAGDVPLNVRSILTLQGLTPIGCVSCDAVAEGQSGGMGVGPFPLPPPWHSAITVIN